ncbi:MAG: ankyrin repeat domain-containing protein [Clostridiales bacterium]|nr:ankyrin repeat domain-containing protein [Clostridiales bacterium]
MPSPSWQEIYEAMMSSKAFMPAEKYVVTDDAVCAMLDQIGDIDHTDERGFSLLMLSVLHRRPAVARYLICRGADVDHQDAKGVSALYLAVHKDMMDVTEMLLEAGADISVRDSGGNTVLHQAPWNISEEHVQLLARSGADADAVNKVGWPARMLLRPELHRFFPAPDA